MQFFDNSTFMIQRRLENKLRELSSYYPVVAVTGPRQSGKTTLCQMVFPNKPYISLESLDMRDFALQDPRSLLKEYADGAIFDEIQQAPALMSYMQGDVDANPDPGRFILTGSQHFGLSQSISQSLSGRCGILVLLPPDSDELRAFPNAPKDLYTLLWQGAYPRIYDRNIPAHQWLADYSATYIQRDVRQVINVGDLQVFSDFLKLCAGRTAQEINLSSLGSDSGVTHNTAKSWLSVLETSYILHRLSAWRTNIRKQIVKSPKLHFFDSGLLCYLLGIREPGQLALHPLRGAIFESWVISEIYKNHVHEGMSPRLFHYREARGLEVDLLIEKGNRMGAVEIKSASTIASTFFRNLDQFKSRLSSLPISLETHLIYGGDQSMKRSKANVWSWKDIVDLPS